MRLNNRENFSYLLEDSPSCSLHFFSLYSFGNMELLTTLARLHDSLLPSLQKGLHIVFASGENTLQEAPSTMLSEVSISMQLLSMRIVNLAWKLLYFCYLSDEAFENDFPFPTSMKMFPANISDPVIRADILLQTIRDIAQQYSHSHEVCWKGTLLQYIEKNHKLMSRVGLLRNAGKAFYFTRLVYSKFISITWVPALSNFSQTI